MVPNEGSAAAYATPLAASRAIIIRSFSVFLRISGTFLNEYAKWASHANSPTSVSAATEQERKERGTPTSTERPMQDSNKLFLDGKELR